VRPLIHSCIASALAAASFAASAEPIVFTASGVGPGGAPLAASASFDITGNTLTIVLSNIAGDNPAQDVDGSTLTGLFFDLTGNPLLTPLSAALSAGSSIVNPGACSNGCAGSPSLAGEFGYATGVFPGGADHGIANAGYLTTGLSGNIGNFNGGAAGTDLDGPSSLDGINFGIISNADGFDPNGGLSSEPLIRNSVTFTLSGVSGLTASDISHVSFQYGSELEKARINGACTQGCGDGLHLTAVPEPASLSLFGVALLGLTRLRRKAA
jgi:hypothetical protein